MDIFSVFHIFLLFPLDLYFCLLRQSKSLVCVSMRGSKYDSEATTMTDCDKKKKKLVVLETFLLSDFEIALHAANGEQNLEEEKKQEVTLLLYINVRWRLCL